MLKQPKYDLLLQNNASKEFFIYSGLRDTGDNHLYYRDDVEYDMNTPILDTILHTGEGDVVLRDLQPSTGLLQIGDGAPVYENIYDKSQDNDLIFYYDN